MEWVIDGKPVDGALIGELRELGAIWPTHFDNLDHVPFRVTKFGYEYVRQLADA
jgi:hypothetical protein